MVKLFFFVVAGYLVWNLLCLFYVLSIVEKFWWAPTIKRLINSWIIYFLNLLIYEYNKLNAPCFNSYSILNLMEMVLFYFILK